VKKTINIYDLTEVQKAMKKFEKERLLKSFTGRRNEDPYSCGGKNTVVKNKNKSS